MTKNDMDKLISKIQKRLKLDTNEKVEKYMINIFMNMKLSDLKNRIDIMPEKWGNKINDTRKYILTIAKEVYAYRVNDK